MESASRKIGVILSYVLVVVQTVIGLLYVPLLLQYLDQNEYGLYQLMGSLIGYFSIMDFGLSNALTSFYSKSLVENDNKKTENLLFTAKTLYNVITAVLIVIAFLFFFFIDDIFKASLSSNEIIQKIAQNGIVGLGGATFPTHVKLTPPKEFKPTVLIVNATECEPYLTDDHALMLESPEQIIIGCHILMKAIHVKQAYIGVENNKRDAIALLKKQAEKYPGIEIVPLRTRYPQGGEKQLIDAILHKQVANGALPVSTGAIVQNVGTAFAVYEAVQKNKPLVERIVTVTGDGVKQPGNYRIRLGMPIRELIEIAGGLPSDSAKVILGGPMMGKAVSNLDAPIPKGCSGILILNEAHAHRSETSSCIRCGKCVSACPMGLEPYLLAKLSENHLFERAEKELITACLECGCCAYSCPSNRPILDYIRIGKNAVNQIIRSRKQS